MLKGPLKLALLIVGSVVAVVLLYVGVTFVQVWMTSHANDPHPADAALVFGTAANYESPRADLEGRLQRALELYQQGLVPLIAVTGGKKPGDKFTEAQISANWLEMRHVPKPAIVLGDGVDTWQNVQDVAPQLHAKGVKTVLVVTDGFHEDRAMAITSDFGFLPSATPSEASPIHGAAEFGYLAKEAVEVAVGRIVGYGTLSSWEHP